MPVKHAGLDLPDLTNTSPDKLMASCFITGHVFAELRVQEVFRTADYVVYLREGRVDVRKWNAQCSEEAMNDTLAGAPVQVAC